MSLSFIAIAMMLPGTAYGIAYNPAMKTFGHSVKNGALPAYPALMTTFEHNCTAAPCTITQLHVPSIYPGGGGGWDWQDGRVMFYVDGEVEPSINITLLELGWVSRWASLSGASNSGGHNTYDNRGLPWGIEQFGHTATSGGIYSTIRIPFGSTIRVAIQAPPTAHANSIYWMIVRGIEANPVDMGGIELPAGARLKVYRNEGKVLANLDMITLGAAPAGTAGAVVGLKYDVVGHSEGFLEACMRFYPSSTTTNPLFLSSGTEDYFLSASYFDEGQFISPNAGLTFKDGGGGIGAYKMHDLRDQVFFDDGFKLKFRSGETTTGCGDELHCPNQWCRPDQSAEAQAESFAATLDAAMASRDSPTSPTSPSAPIAPAPGAPCTPGPVAVGFDRPGGDRECWSMNASTGTEPTDCAAMCCDQPWCTAWVHAQTFSNPYKGCLGDGGACCWLKEASEQLTVDLSKQNISSGEIAGRGGSPAPGPAPPGPAAPPAPKPPNGTVFNTLLYTYEWPKQAVASAPATDTSPALAEALRAVQALSAAKKITASQSDAAIDLMVLEPASRAGAGLLRLLGGLAAGAADPAVVTRYLARHTN